MNDMPVFRGFSVGFNAYGEAVRLLFSRHFGWFLLFPVTISVLLFLAGNYVVGHYGAGLSGFLEAALQRWVGDVSWLKWLSGLGGVVGFILRLLLRIIYSLMFLFWGGYLLMLFMSPIYSWLSERTESHLSGVKYPFSFRQFFWEIGRGIVIALGCVVLQTAITIFLFFCSFIPVVGWVSPILSFLVTAYFYGFAFMDYAVERKKFKLKEGVAFINRSKGSVLAIGMVFAVSLFIPFLRIFAVSLVSLLAVIAGTIVIHRQETNR